MEIHKRRDSAQARMLNTHDQVASERPEVRIHLISISSSIPSVSWMATLIHPLVRAWWCWADRCNYGGKPTCQSTQHFFWINHSPTFHLITPNMNLRNFSIEGSPIETLLSGNQPNLGIAEGRLPKLQTCYHTNNLPLHEVQSDEILDNNQTGLFAVDERIFELRHTSPSFLSFLKITKLTPGYPCIGLCKTQTGSAIPVAVCNRSANSESPEPSHKSICGKLG